MSSEALERAEALLAVEASSVRAPSWWFAAARSAARDVLALLAEVARLEQERDEKAEASDNWYAAFAVAREREQRLREAAEVVVGEWHADNPFVGVRIEVLEDALVDEPAAAGAGHNLCACGSTLIVCAKCGDSRCLVCDPYDELDTCGATEPAAAIGRQAGQTLLEYAVILALISLALVACLFFLKDRL